MTNPNGQNPAQPTGKRQLRGVSPVSTDAYEQKRTPAQPDTDEDSRKSSVAAFPGEVVEEMRKVIWPTGREMVTYSIVVLVFLVLMTALVAGVDYVTGLGVRWVFGV